MNAVLERSQLIKENVTLDYGLVSIIMPSYNSAKFIKETAQSGRGRK